MYPWYIELIIPGQHFGGEELEPVVITVAGSPETLKHLLPFSEYKIHTYDEIETILLEKGLK